jgi:hypothetical protein
MTVRVNKSPINIREKLNELDYAQVPYEKMPAGSVIQVSHGTTSTEVAVNSNAETNTGLSATISPRFSSSKILVLVSHDNCEKITTSSSATRFKLYRQNSAGVQVDLGTQAGLSGGFISYAMGLTNATATARFNVNFQWFDTPSTTDSLIYYTNVNNYVSATGVRVQAGGYPSRITLMEIAQ